MTEPSTSPTPATNPAPAPASTPAPTSVTLGFLTIVTEASGVLGGYLVTNAWGRPLEFRLSTAVQPNRVQQILYGPTLTEYLHSDLIGKTLVEKTSVQPTLIVTDSLHALALQTRLGVPTVAIEATEIPAGSEVIRHPRCSLPLILPPQDEAARAILDDRLNRVDPAVDLAEPFARIREAVAEARKLGANNRAA